MKYNETAVLIDELELFVMSALKGKEKIYGFAGIDTDNLKKEDIIMVMQRLCLQGIAEIRDNQLALCKPYDNLIADICDASSVVITRIIDNTKPVICAYCGRNLIIAESTGRKKGELRVISSPEGGIVGYLKANGYLPGTDDFGKSLIEYQDDISICCDNNSEQILGIETVNAKNGASTGKIFIHKGELFYTINKDGRSLRYSEEALRDSINEILYNNTDGEVI